MDSFPDDAGPMPDMSRSAWYEHEDHFKALVGFLDESADIRTTARSSMKQAAYAGGGAVAGGMLMGPFGGLVGGIAGSVVGYVKADEYKGVMNSVMHLNSSEKKKLVKHVGTILVAAGATAKQFESPEAFKTSLIELANNPSVRGKVWNVVKKVATENPSTAATTY